MSAASAKKRLAPVESPASSRLRRLAVLVVFVAAFVTYLPSLTYDFTGWDDIAYIVDNPHMKHVGGLSRIWASRENEAYYPLTFTAMWIQYQWFGDRPLGYHAVCIVLHAINAAFLLVLLRRLKLPEPAAIIAALLFALHPVQVMSVAFVAEQKNLISCFCVLAAIGAWVKSHGGSRRWFAASIVWYAAAVLAKSAVLGLPIALAALDLFVFRRGTMTTVKRVLPLIIVACVSALLTVMFEQKFVDPGDAGGIPPPLERLLLAAAAPWWYLWHLAIPTDLSPFYPLWEIARSDWKWWIALIAWVIFGIAALASLRKPPHGAFGWVIWAITHFAMLLGPSLGLIPFGNMHATFVSDHFLYVASIGPLTIAGLGLAAVAIRWKPAFALAGVILLTLGIQSLSYMPVFRNEMALWRRGVERSPENYVTNIGLAVAQMNRAIETGDREPRFQARTLLDRAKSIQPNMADAFLHAGENELELGNLDSAEQDLLRYNDLNPNFPRAIEKLGFIYERTGRPDEALLHYENAARLDPRNHHALLGLGRMYLGFGRHGAAEPVFGHLIEIRPDIGMAYVGLATCLRAKGEWVAAADALRRGLQPTHDDLAVLNMLALIYATSQDPQVQNGREAVAIMERIVAEHGRSNHQILDTLAAAYAAAGRFDDAVRVSEESAVVSELAGNAAATEESRRRAALYRQSQPLRH